MCIDGVDSYSCACVAGFSGTNCGTSKLCVVNGVLSLLFTMDINNHFKIICTRNTLSKENTGLTDRIKNKTKRELEAKTKIYLTLTGAVFTGPCISLRGVEKLPNL